MADLDGMLLVRKELGYTSNDVVAKLRGILHMKKIGHTGTLDPQAGGLLPVCLGRATKLVDLITDKEKTYETVLHLGITTDTQDMTGSFISEMPVNAGEDEVRECIAGFIGDRMQLPPMYSALKVKGKRLYELAREGVTVERQPRPVTFYELTILDMKLPLVTIRVRCSKGTYIRTLCHDIGQKLGCGGCMESLLRTRVGAFDLSEAMTLSEIEELSRAGAISDHIIPIEDILIAYPRICVTKAGDILLYNGNAIIPEFMESEERSGWIRLCDSQSRFRGIYQWNEKRWRYEPVKMFYAGDIF